MSTAPIPANNDLPALTKHPVGSKHPGFKKCPHCGVVGYVGEETLIKALKKGLENQLLQIVSVAKEGQIEGTITGMLGPLRRLLNDKGMRVK